MSLVGIIANPASGKDIRRLARLQRKILEHAAPLVKPGGIVLYATCTLTAEENEGVVESFLAASDNFALDTAASYLPEPARHLVLRRSR